MRFKINWASLIVGKIFIVFAWFYFAFEGNFKVQAPGGGIFGGFLEGLIFGKLLNTGSLFTLNLQELLISLEKSSIVRHLSNVWNV